LEFANGRWHIQDLLSANGTFVNGHLVQNADLGENDVVAIGKLRFRFRLLHDQSETRESTAGTAAQVSGLTSAKTEKLSIEVTQLSDAPARCFANRFELQNVIHRGSTGSFYKALDLEKDCVVCVELLSPTMSRDEPELKRFVRSLRKATRLRHDNIVRLLRAGRYKSQWWLAMEYVDGPSLREVIEQNAKGIAPARVVEIALDVTTALEKAHRRQLVHRAITPGKVLLTKAGAAKLSGFAFVDNAVLANLQRQSALTKLVHDLTYMAPECVEHASRADCRADIYSLAACLYTLLTGCPPFTGELAEQLIEIRKEMPIPIRRLNPVVPRQLEDIIMRCLAKDPVERFQNPLQLREELNRIGKATD
jgi:serine/threonine-protein kinase